MPRPSLTIAACVASLACGDVPAERGASFGGASMGTTFHVQVVELPDGLRRERLQADVARLLDGLDAAMSTWRDDSELARFNARRDPDWVAVDPRTCRVVRAAHRVSRLTGGALDVTAGPLVELWGFGAAGRRHEPPDPEALAAARARVGWERLEVHDDRPALRKTRSDVAVDLSALAKGFAVDELAEHLLGLGVERFLVGFGGELRGHGDGPAGGPWRIGIERPAGRELPGLPDLALRDAAVATSGDAHNAFEWGGRRYGHVIDPRSGWPAERAPASVSVVASTAVDADALATALSVLGVERGLELAEREGLAALFVRRTGERTAVAWSSAMEPWLLVDPPPAPPATAGGERADALDAAGALARVVVSSVVIVAFAMAALSFGTARAARRRGRGARPLGDGRAPPGDDCTLCTAACDRGAPASRPPTRLTGRSLR